MLAVVVGMLIVSAFTFLMGFIMLGAMLSAGDSKPVIKDGSVLRINLSGNLQERVQANPVSVFLGMSGTEEQGLDNILKSIKSPPPTTKSLASTLKAAYSVPTWPRWKKYVRH